MHKDGIRGGREEGAANREGTGMKWRRKTRKRQGRAGKSAAHGHHTLLSRGLHPPPYPHMRMA